MLGLLSLTGPSAQVVPLIVGGEPAQPNTFPWMAALFETGFTPESSQFCGGSLIAPGWVMTAAHCFPESGVTNVSVLLDENVLSDAASGVEVDSIITHPDYVDDQDAANFLDNDIALLRLSAKQPLATASVADAQSQQFAEVVTANRLETLGWGASNPAGDQSPVELQYVRLQFLPLDQCRDFYSLTANMFCAWEPDPPGDAPDGQDTCFGDSGGPLFISQNDAPFVVGLTSFGRGNRCGLDRSGNAVPSGFTRIVNYPGWIEQVTNNVGDPLVALRASIPGNLMSGADGDGSLARVPVSVHNTSILNSASGVGFTLQLPVAVSLEDWDDTELSCNGGPGEWQCDFHAEPLQAGETFTTELDLRYGGDEGLAAVSARGTADQDSYRVARASSGLTEILFTDKPILEMGISARTGNQRTTLTYSIANLSGHVTATGTMLTVNLPAGLSLSDTSHAGCQAVLGAVICALGDLPPQAETDLSITLVGANSSYTLVSELTSDSGNYPDDPLSITSSVKLKADTHGGSSDSGMITPWLLFATALFAYRRRPNQSSSQSSS